MKSTSVFLKLSMCFMIGVFACEERPANEQPAPVQGNPSSALPHSQSRIADYDLTGSEGDPITMETATRWIKNYQEENPNQNQAHFFGYEIIKQLLGQDGCVGIRIYYGIDDNGVRQLMLVGTDAKGNDLLPSTNGRTT
ncbi:MAG: hypothetical protein L0Y35_04810, partial [Flammeovirgaceae bacterium]|nr:hypothetical protein [Flammeovirgaceae bacterium]